MHLDAVPAEHQQKSTLLVYFAQYMDEHLIHGGDMLQSKKESVSLPHTSTDTTAPGMGGVFMKKWFRTNKAIVMYLNNGTLQVSEG